MLVKLYNRIMEIAIGIGIGVVIAVIAGRRKKLHGRDDVRPETANERKRRETDELITVVLPTIGNDR